MKKLYLLFFLLTYVSVPLVAADVPSLPEIVTSQIKTNMGNTTNDYDFLTVRNQIKIIGFLALISLIPFGIMVMTSFTRISIIFQFLRQALGTVQVPSNQILIGLSLILTGFIMHPVIKEINQKAITPYLSNTFKNSPDVLSKNETEESIFLEKAWEPLRQFLLTHTREKDLQLFLDIAHIQLPSQNQTAQQNPQEVLDQIPWYCIVPAFIMSELRTAFMMGFLLFLPFLIIDMVVASVLMSMGMMMLPPVMVSTPFKLLLFILIDGWRLIIQQIVNGYHPLG